MRDVVTAQSAPCTGCWPLAIKQASAVVNEFTRFMPSRREFARDIDLGAAPDARIAERIRQTGDALLTRDLEFADVRQYRPTATAVLSFCVSLITPMSPCTLIRTERRRANQPLNITPIPPHASANANAHQDPEPTDPDPPPTQSDSPPHR
jgi:hypothetical protein